MTAALELLAVEPKAELDLGQPARAAQRLSGRRHRMPHHHGDPDILQKLALVGRDLDEFSLDTVKMFHTDGQRVPFSI